MNFMTWVNLESFRTTTATTYTLTNFFLDNPLDHIFIKYSFHLFLIKIRLLPEDSPLRTFEAYYHLFSSFYCCTNNGCSLKPVDAENLLNIFFSHLHVSEEDLRYIFLLKIENRIFITKQDTSFPSDSLSLIDDKQYLTIYPYLRKHTNHPFLHQRRVVKDKESFLVLPEFPKTLIYHLRDLYKGLLEEFSILTPRDEDDQWSADKVFDYLIGMYNFFNIHNK